MNGEEANLSLKTVDEIVYCNKAKSEVFRENVVE